MFHEEKIDSSYGIRIAVHKNEQEIGHAYVYILRNDLHDAPFGLLEDVEINENYRGHGFGKQLMQKVIEVAKREGCYKLIGTSRYARELVHSFYTQLGFEDYGKEFRMNLSSSARGGH